MRHCHYCGEIATTKDHIVPKVRGGLNRQWNYAPSCFDCNLRKGADWPTCDCLHCFYAVARWMQGERNPIKPSIRVKIRRKRGVWLVMIPNAGSKSTKRTFRTLKAAHKFVDERLTPPAITCTVSV